MFRFRILQLILPFIFILHSANSKAQNIGSYGAININEVYVPFNNKGIIADVNVPPNGSGGKFGGGSFLYSGGFWLSGYSNNYLWANGVSTADLVDDYQPGIVGMDPSHPKASLYKLRNNTPPFDQSWEDWRDAVSLGASYYDGDQDGQYNPVDLNSNGVWDPDEDKPDIIGDETYWCVYNDGIPAAQRRWESQPQGIEIRQTIFAYNNGSDIDHSIFIRYRIKNTGLVTDVINDVFFSSWADVDLGDPSDDLTGCDTVRGCTYSYNDGVDPLYGVFPPAFMIETLTGPVSYIPGETFIDNNGNNVYDPGVDTALDTAFIYKGPLGLSVYEGAKNLSMNSSVAILNSISVEFDSPDTSTQARNYMLGKNKDGNLLDPCTSPVGIVSGGIPCDQVNPVYWFSGDPVSGIGWLHTLAWDIRKVQTIGPFELAKNKYIDILVAYEVNSGTDPLGGITAVREVSDAVQAFYDNNFGFPIFLSVDDAADLSEFRLEQNYPNPFNPSTKIKYSVPSAGKVTIKVFDILGNEIQTLVNENKSAGEYEAIFDASSLASGVYFYRMISTNYVDVKKMVLIR